MKKANTSVERGWQPRPWIAAVLGFFLQPLGMLYVVRVKWALAYFFVTAVITISELTLWWYQRIEWLQYFSFTWIVMIACAIHAYRIAKYGNPVAVRPWYSRWYGLIALLGVLFLAIFSFRTFMYEPFRKPSGSMAPSINTGSVVLAQKWGYGNYGTYGISVFRTAPSRKTSRGDIVVFEFPPDPSIKYLKRVIGLPGDVVKYQRKKLFINDVPVETELISSGEGFDVLQETLEGSVYRVMNSRTRPSPDMEFVVPENNYFVVGDNRDHSNDSRYWGFVPERNIVGKVVYVLRH